MNQNIYCTIKEEKINLTIEDAQPIYVTIEGGGIIQNFSELIAEYGLMKKSIYDTDENGIIDFAEAIKSGITICTALQIKEALDKAHTHLNKSILDSISWDEYYKTFMISKS